MAPKKYGEINEFLKHFASDKTDCNTPICPRQCNVLKKYFAFYL